MPLLVPVAILLLLAPGYALSRLLGSRAPWASTLIVSLLILFHGAFLAGVCGLPVRFVTVAAFLVGVTGLAALAARRWAPPAPDALSASKDEAPARLKRVALAVAVFIGAGLLLRCTLQPLAGYDTQWRWDFLARRVLEQGDFNFYPALTAEDFAVYSYAESIPPLVAFSYWWLYAAAGQHLAELTALLVVAQYAAIVWLTYRTGAVLFSKRAGLLAVIVLTTSLLFYRALAIGQETGLTALSMIALTYFIVSAGEPPDYRAMVLAGLSAALGALAREYGWAFVACGLLVLGWRRRGWKEMAVFVLTACAVAGPWYLRTMLLTGNPLYSNRLLGLPVNPVHAGIMDSYVSELSVRHWSAAKWADLGRYLLEYAPAQLLLGPVAALVFARRHGYLSLAAGLVVVLALTSVGYTSGLATYAMRVLAPALVLLSLLVGALLDRVRRPAVMAVLTLLLAVQFARAAVYAAIHPAKVYPTPDRAPALAWPQAALYREPHAPVSYNRREEMLPGLLEGKLPPGARLLAENTYAYAALAGTDHQVVPVWSPEVLFLFDKGLDAGEMRRRLRGMNIPAVVYNPDSRTTHYLLRESPLFADAPKGWKVVAELEGTKTVIYELPPE
jgi:hypothetical protein